MTRLGAPVVPPSGGLGRPGEGGSEHDGVGPAGDGFDDVAGVAHRAVGDHMDIAPSGLVEVVAAGGGDIGHRGGHGHIEAQHLPHGGGGAAALADEHGSGTGAHEMEGGGVGGHPADDDGHIQLVDEALEVEGLGIARDVLGGDH